VLALVDAILRTGFLTGDQVDAVIMQAMPILVAAVERERRLDGNNAKHPPRSLWR
jgi:hypothetical protein